MISLKEKRHKRYIEHKDEEIKRNKEWYAEHYLQYPWLRQFKYIKKRVKHHPHYVQYGIKNYLTKINLKFLWFRDRAYLLKKPSIDRIKSDGNYTKENCRFIELNENLRRKRVWRKQKIGKEWYPLSSL